MIRMDIGRLKVHLLWIIPSVIVLLFLYSNSFKETLTTNKISNKAPTIMKFPVVSKRLTAQDIGLRKESGVIFKGSVPLSTDWIMSQFKPFLTAYNNRPSMDNRYGSKVMHQFALWCLIKHLKPNHIIESGIYQGLGTWILRQAAPNAQIILLDPNGKAGSVYKDTHKDTIYMIGNKFKDFKSVNWTEILDPKTTLVFIDDHQYPIRRLREALKYGFRHVMFDDNYWHVGDVLSLKQIVGIFNGDLNIKKFPVLENNLKIKDENAILNDATDMFANHVQTYWEFPQMWTCHIGQCNTNPDSDNHLLQLTDGAAVLKQYGLTNLPPKDQISGYYNIVYLRLY